MEEIKSNAGQGLGTAGLVLGILAIPLGIVPCTFYLGILFGLAGIVLSIVALKQANQWNAPKALIVAALTCSILGFSFAAAWTIALSGPHSHLRRLIEDIRSGEDFNFPRPPDEGRIFIPEHEVDSLPGDYNSEDIRAMEDTLRSLEHELRSLENENQ
jgi:hypothetical protein